MISEQLKEVRPKEGGLFNEIVSYDVTYKLDAEDVKTARNNGVEAQLYQIWIDLLQSWIRGKDRKRSEERTYDETLTKASQWQQNC